MFFNPQTIQFFLLRDLNFIWFWQPSIFKIWQYLYDNIRHCSFSASTTLIFLTLKFLILQHWIFTKQWLLAQEFSECEYSASTRSFGEYSHSPKWGFFDTPSDLPDLNSPKMTSSQYSPDSTAFGEWTMLSIERERLYIMYIERESLKEQVETFLNLSLSFTHTQNRLKPFCF